MVNPGHTEHLDPRRVRGDRDYFCRRTISAIQMGAKGEVQFGGVG